MAKKKFIPLTGLDTMTEEQKAEYKINACEYFEIPPELSLLEFMWLDSGDAGRHLVLYAKKGATDIMRANRGICVDDIKETLGDGFIMFTAKGHDKTGRTDVAVGAADTRGRSGKYLSDAIMTAQTRATRRLTLQFVGGGLLDESEVQSTTTDISRAAQPLAEIATPAQLSPNPAPGRDITQEKPAEKELTKAIEKAVFNPEPNVVLSVGDKVQMTTGEVAQVVESGTAPKKRRRRKSEVVLDTAPETASSPTPAQAAAAEALKKIDFSKTNIPEDVVPPPVVKECLTCKVPVHDGPATINGPASIIYLNADNTPHVCVKAEAPPPPVLKDQPSEAQKKEFRERLFNYTNNILRQAKMVPCEGIGGVENKIKAFVGTMFPQTKEVKYLTVNQWETFLGYLDEKHKELGGEGLVKLINEKIGAKE